MDKYLKNLIRQYVKATGTKNIDVESKAFVSDFKSWIYERQLVGNKYLNMLKYIFSEDDFFSDVVEVDKGMYDSIALDSGITIISPYIDVEKINSSSSVINSKFRVYNGEPVLFNSKEDNQNYVSNVAKIFMTQNPYAPVQIVNWEQLHNNGGKKIVVGVYGNTFDNDIDDKIKQLKDFKSKLKGNYQIEYDFYKDEYYYAVMSKDKSLTKRKVISRKY